MTQDDYDEGYDDGYEEGIVAGREEILFPERKSSSQGEILSSPYFDDLREYLWNSRKSTSDGRGCWCDFSPEYDASVIHAPVCSELRNFFSFHPYHER